MKRKIILILLSTICLTSCNHKTSDSTITREVKEIQLTSLTKADTTYNDSDSVKELNMNTLYSNNETPHLNPIGNQNVLVVPFSFEKDTTDVNDTITSDASLLEKISTTFTANEEEINSKGGNISVKDFYNKSSYGKSNIQIDVLNTFVKYSGTPSKFKQDVGSKNAGVFASSYISEYYNTEYNKVNHGQLGSAAKPLTYYDSDKDGFIDLMWIVYSYPYDQRDTSLWWAYVTYTGNSADIDNPTVQTLGWASSDFLYSDSSDGYDAHTFIHETGHTYGLSDYYDYNRMTSPLGGVDYMDQNLGDHCAYSKFALGWINPYVVKEEDLKDNDIELNLNALTTSSEAIVLASPSYNNTAFDEYFMIELVAPVSFAKKDYLEGYSIDGYSKPGIRITHIDSRVYDLDHDTYLKTKEEVFFNGKALRLSNSYLGRISLFYDGDYFEVDNGKQKNKRSYSLISLMESNIKDINTTNSASYTATNDSLFKQGDSFYLQKDNKPSIWAKTYMPSESALYNKSKTITGWKSTTEQEYNIDENMKFPFKIDVLDIKEDNTYGYTSKIKISIIQ